ncbi:MAG TPA: neutral zinc metallopeptidase [Acidimicrobiales bacterium]|nr:neutral zinc metallopeptidase [Acidimicrobiales bacterium]
MKRIPTSVLGVGVASALAVACAQPADDLAFTTGPGTPSEPIVADDPGAVAQRAVDDVNAYWRQTYPEVYGEEFRELAGFHPYGPDTAPPPCGVPPPEYEMIADNAFYCPIDDIIAWDEHLLMPSLNEDFGAFTVAIVIAHEFGHAIQDRARAADRTLDLELQADCFAGAWTAHVAAGEAPSFSPDDLDLDRTVAGMLSIRDMPGTSPDDPFAHGSGFDRVSGFQDGFENGAAKCAEYADPAVDRRTAEIEFTDTELVSNGNLHLEDRGPDDLGLLTLVETDLNDFYGQLFDELGEQFTPVADLVLVDPASDQLTCDGRTLAGDDLDLAALYCQAEQVVVLDGPGLVTSLNDDVGDFAVASEIARLWALAAQTQLGVAASPGADLQADCLTGRWAAWTYPTGDGARREAESDNLVMSAGDLDEGLMGFLVYGAVLGDEDRTVFERTAALRTGFFESYEACEEFAPLG